MRLCDLTPEQIEEWRRVRLEAGRAKYGDAHLRRYGMVDVAEEVQDGINILHLHLERNKAENPNGMDLSQYTEFMVILRDLHRVMEGLQRLDALLPDSLCTDEQGGHRVWWSEQAGTTGDDPTTTTYRQADPDDGYWECAKCEAKWTFFDGGPRDNSMAYCPECGRKVVGEVRWGDQADYTPCPTCEELPTWCGCNREGGGGDE